MRNELMGVIGANECGDYILNEEQLNSFNDIISFYCEIPNIREVELSTIWSEMEEASIMRIENGKFKFIIDLINNEITLKEFLDMACEWQEDWILDEWAVDGNSNEIFEEIFENIPPDLECDFIFTDSF